MTQNEFQIGDVVKLKSSDQKFVVFKVEQHMINCVMWSVDLNRTVETGMYDYHLFIKAD